MRKYNDLSGQQFEYLTVLRRSENVGNGKKPVVMFECRCKCGKIINVSGNALLSGHTKSCGCRKTKHHGRKDNPKLYEAWQNMKRRINDPTNKRYERYGGRGIKICPEWQEFIPFRDWSLANGYKDGLMIDRIDNDGDYCPENCRWSDRIEQMNNTSRNHFIDVKGERMTMAQAARALGLTYSTVQHRIQRGHPLWD